jgi:hypothetical protein
MTTQSFVIGQLMWTSLRRLLVLGNNKRNQSGEIGVVEFVTGAGLIVYDGSAESCVGGSGPKSPWQMNAPQ